MVAIVQSDPYQVLSRKIGYSVGLEFLLRNTQALNDIYVDKGTVSLADWKTLVKDHFNRVGENDRPAIEIANFLSALKQIRIFGNELHILYGLDIFSIIKRYFADDAEKYVLATKIVLTFLLLEADGDIFLNCLAAEFDETKTKSNLEDMIRIKWGKFQSAFRNPALQHKIWDIISIKTQGASKSTKSKPISPFEPTGQNPFARRTDVLGERPQTEAVVAESYLRKVLPTRKGWAKDLEYFDESNITPLGISLLKNLEALKLEESDSYCFWPYETELQALRIDPPALGAPSLNSWNILQGIANAHQAVRNSPPTSSLDNKSVVDLLWEIFQLYRKGSTDRGSIRHQLPLYILKPVIASICIANNYKLVPLYEILDEEYRRPERIVNFTNIRGTEGAIIFKNKP